MNENPEGTPNPLNPNPGPAPAGAGPAPAAPAAPVAPAPQPTPPVAAQPAAAAPVAAPVAEPITEPEPKGSVVEPKNKPKTGLIVTIILLVCAVIGGIVAAILILKPFGNNGDAVTMALQKLFEDTRPAKVSADGSIIATLKDSDGKIKIDFKSGVDTVSKENYANIAVTLVSPDDDEFSFGADEVYTKDGDLYLRVSNIEEFMDYLMTANTAQTNCYGDDDFNCGYLDGGCTKDEFGNINCEDIYTQPQSFSSMPSYLSDIIEMVDDEWVRISSSEFGDLTKMLNSNTDNTTQCVIDVAKKADKYEDDFAGFYEDNPFIESTTENVKIERKKSQPYLISFDNEKLAGFLNSAVASDFVKDLAECSGSSVPSEEISAEDLDEMAKNFPELYVEIDNDYNFTRVYLKSDGEDTTITIDFSFDYPTSIKVEEPEEYTDINDVITEVMKLLYGQTTSQQS